MPKKARNIDQLSVLEYEVETLEEVPPPATFTYYDYTVHILEIHKTFNGVRHWYILTVKIDSPRHEYKPFPIFCTDKNDCLNKIRDEIRRMRVMEYIYGHVPH